MSKAKAVNAEDAAQVQVADALQAAAAKARAVAKAVWAMAATLVGLDLERKVNSKKRWRTNARQIARMVHDRRTADAQPLPGDGSLEAVQRIVYRYMRALYATDTDKFCLPEHVPGSRTMRADGTETEQFIGLRAKIPNYVKKAGGGFTISDEVAASYRVDMPDDLGDGDDPEAERVLAAVEANADADTPPDDPDLPADGESGE